MNGLKASKTSLTIGSCSAAVILGLLAAFQVIKVMQDMKSPAPILTDLGDGDSEGISEQELQSATLRDLFWKVEGGKLDPEVAKNELLRRYRAVRDYFYSLEGQAFCKHRSIFEVLGKLDMYCGSDAQFLITGDDDMSKMMEAFGGFPSLELINGDILPPDSDINSFGNGFFLENGLFVTAEHCTGNLSSNFDLVYKDEQMDRAFYRYTGDLSKLDTEPIQNPVGAPIYNGDIIMCLGHDRDGYSRHRKKMIFTNAIYINQEHEDQIRERWEKLKTHESVPELAGSIGFIINHSEANNLSGLSGSPIFNTRYEVVGIISEVLQVPKFDSIDEMNDRSADDGNYFLVLVSPITPELVSDLETE